MIEKVRKKDREGWKKVQGKMERKKEKVRKKDREGWKERKRQLERK